MIISSEKQYLTYMGINIAHIGSNFVFKMKSHNGKYYEVL